MYVYEPFGVAIVFEIIHQALDPVYKVDLTHIFRIILGFVMNGME